MPKRLYHSSKQCHWCERDYLYPAYGNLTTCNTCIYERTGR